MTQYTYLLDPAVHTGTDLANFLNSSNPAFYSSHRGSSRPTYAVAGMIWIDTSVTNIDSVKYYDGTHDILLYSFNTTSGAVVEGGPFTPGAMFNEGNINPTVAAPGATRNGDLYIVDTAGTAHASFTGIAGTAMTVGDIIFYDGTVWRTLKLQSTLGAYVAIAGSTMTGDLKRSVSGVSQPFTTLDAADVVSRLSYVDGVAGGAALRGYSSGGEALRLSGFATTPGVTLGNGVVRFDAGKHDGAGGVAALGVLDVGYSFKNGATTLFDIKGSGNLFALGGLVTGGLTTSDVDPGGICVFTDTADLNFFTLKNSDVATPFTSIFNANTLFAIRKYDNNLGGAAVYGITEGAVGLHLGGYSVTPNTTTGAGIINVDGRRSDGGTGTVVVAATDNLFTVQNRSNNVLTIKGNGNQILLGGLSTGGETAPDVDLGGICINTGSADGFMMSFKNSDIAHGATAIAQTNTLGFISKLDPNTGGLLIRGFTEASAGIFLAGTSTTPPTTTSGYAPVVLHGAKISGTGAAAITAAEYLLSVHNNSSQSIFGIKGNGDVTANSIALTTALSIANGGTGQITANAALNALLPAQAGSDGKFLSTDGTNSSWQSVASVDIFQWKANMTTTAAGIAAGQIRWNNATQTLATQLFISTTTDNGVNLSSYFNALTIGSRISIQQQSAAGNFQKWDITSKVDNTTYYTFGVTLVSSGGSAYSANNTLNVGFIAVGSGGISVSSISNGTSSVSIPSTNGPIISTVNGAEALRIDTNKRLGLGVTPYGWGSTFSIMDLGAGGGIFGLTNQFGMSGNLYHDGTNWKYKETNPAALMQLFNGTFVFGTAPSGTAGANATVTTRMMMDNAGRLGLGVVPSAWNSVYTSLDVSTIGGIQARASNGTVYLSCNAYNSGSWAYKTAGAISAIQLGTDGSTAIYTAPTGTADGAATLTERLRLDVAGRLGLGIVPSAWTTLTSFDIGPSGAIASQTSQTIHSNNIFYDGAWKYKATGAGCVYEQNAGRHTWYNSLSGTAGAVATQNEAMRLDTNNVLVINSIRCTGAVPTSTQDAVQIQGRAGGTSSFAVTLTPTTLTANRTLTLPDKTDTIATLSDIAAGGATSISNGTSSLAITSSGGPIVTTTGGTVRNTIEADGRWGVNGTAFAWATDYGSIDLGLGGAIYSSKSTSQVSLMNNIYHNGSSFIRKANGLGAWYNLTSGAHTWYSFATGSAGSVASPTTTMQLDASGNLSLGTAFTWGAGMRAIDIGQEGTLAGDATSSYTFYASNVRFDGTNTVRKVTDEAAMYLMQDGVHKWFVFALGTSGSTLSLTAPNMTLNLSGNLGLGLTPYSWGAGSRALDIGGTASIESANSGNSISITSNIYYGSAWTRKTAAVGTAYFGIDGYHNWHVIPTGAAGSTFTLPAAAMSIDPSGNFTVPGIYASTTATAANVTINSAGLLQRSTSSLRYKKNVQNFIKGLSDVVKMRPVTYQSKNEDDDKIRGGFIAEDLHALGLGEFVEYAEIDGEQKPDSINYGNLTALLTNAVKELLQRIESMELILKTHNLI